VSQQLQFLNVLRKLAETLFRGDSVSLWTGTHLENLDHEKSLLTPDKIYVNSRAALNIQYTCSRGFKFGMHLQNELLYDTEGDCV